jgi:hypothetical protein
MMYIYVVFVVFASQEVQEGLCDTSSVTVTKTPCNLVSPVMCFPILFCTILTMNLSILSLSTALSLE